jgi:hypothetical protein
MCLMSEMLRRIEMLAVFEKGRYLRSSTEMMAHTSFPPGMIYAYEFRIQHLDQIRLQAFAQHSRTAIFRIYR